MRLRLKRMRELCAVFVSLVRQDGISSTVQRALGFARRRLKSKKGRFLPPKAVLESQRALDYSTWPHVSICVPVYNTPRAYLEQMWNSVAGQTCPNWQLCVADASDAAHAYVGEFFAAKKNVRYCKVANNGISANTNAAAQLAGGEYLALLDHDDVLAPHAVYEMLKAARQTGAAFLYSDEALFETSIERPSAGHFKPDFAPDYLNCCNYICHFAMFQAGLFHAVGGLDSACDGAQDHDLFLKLSERCTPVHVPKVLYYWRVHAGSTSGGTAAKPYVTAAAKRAIAAHLARTGAEGTVQDGLFPSTYKVDYTLAHTPLVSILIPNKDHTEDLDKALRSILEKTDYPAYEVIVIENNSTQPQTFAYYETIARDAAYSRCRVVQYQGPFNFSTHKSTHI